MIRRTFTSGKAEGKMKIDLETMDVISTSHTFHSREIRQIVNLSA